MIESGRWNHRYVTFPIILFVTIFILWSIFSEVDEVVRGSGRVIPSSQTKIIQHLEGGIVEKIYVKEGDNVKKGDAIYRLKNATSEANSKKKQISLSSLEQQYKRIKAQVEFKEFVELSDLSQNEQDIYKQEMLNFNDKLSALKDKVSQTKLEKKQKVSRLQNLRNELKTANENLKIAKELLKKGATSKKQYLLELSKKQALVTQISDIRSSIPIMDQKISEAQNKIKGFKSEIKSKWLKKLNEVETKIKQLEEEKSAQKDREERKIVVSPVNGIVKKLYFHTMGGIVKAGDRIAEITPLDDKLIIEAKIKTNDRGQVVVNQDVSIAITAYNYAKFGLLKGKLLSISPDSFVDKNGMSYYQVRVRADKYNFAKDKPILPGMVADINILTGKKTIFRYILKPLKDITKNALHEK